MMKKTPQFLVISLAILTLMGSGCAINDLKAINRRLKESNDRLVAENNRLEQELAASEKDVEVKARQIDQLRHELSDLKLNTPVARARPASLKDDLQMPPEIEIQHTPRGILLRLQDQVFFSLGRATLSTRGKSILDRVAQQLRGRYRDHLIRVEGHTDDIPVKKVKKIYPSNWELSTARACAVVRYLVDRGKLTPTRIYPAGYAYHRPISTAKTDAARSKNRRVEILILNERV